MALMMWHTAGCWDTCSVDSGQSTTGMRIEGTQKRFCDKLMIPFLEGGRNWVHLWPVNWTVL